MSTSSPEASSINPDDVCGVCDETRENHGDKMHEFSIDGVLKKISPRPAPQNTPPRERNAEAERLSRDPEVKAMLRLTERLIEKNVLDAMDVLYIFGGGSDAQPGGAPSPQYRNPGL
jgi:hypothetical protein